MGQTVSDIMTKALVALSAGDTVREAARRMREANVGAIVVQKHGNLFGIVTDRDIVVRCLAHGGDCDAIRLEDICSAELATLRPDDDVDHAVRLMRDKAIRRVPVVKNGKAVGILSLGDLALERDPFSALGAISGAQPNNELRGDELRGDELRSHDPSAVASKVVAPNGSAPKISAPKDTERALAAPLAPVRSFAANRRAS